MSETSGKSSKKGFKAPVLQVTVQEVTDESIKNETVSKCLKNLKKVQEKKEEVNENCAVTKKTKELKKPQVSLTDLQYEEIFKAVLKNTNSQPNTPTEESLEAVANSLEKPLEKDGLKMLPTHSEESVKTSVSLKGKNTELSPWGSHLSKQSSQASSILKELRESQASSLLSPEPSSSNEDTEVESGADEELSRSTSAKKQISRNTLNEANEELSRSTSAKKQTSRRALNEAYEELSRSTSPKKRTPRPALTATAKLRRSKVDKRSVLEELQAQRNVGLWVYCDRMTCQKQRYLPHVTDPQELPDIWYCHMNPDPRYNSCSCEEQQPSPEEEEDMIDNEFTCGSVVWAQVTGFPWWPAMVDDDPDLECYYWLEEDWRTVTFYHVVFFDKTEVSRAWIPINKIVPFKKNQNSFRQRVMRGIDFSSRLKVAREQAEEAANMNIVQRLKKYSFIARYKGPIFDDETQIEKTKEAYKLKCSIGQKEAAKRGRKRRASTNHETLTPFEAVVKSSSKDKKMKNFTEGKDEKLTTNDKDESGSNTELSEVADKQVYKKSVTASFVPMGDQIVSTKTSESKPIISVESQNSYPKVDKVEDKKITEEKSDGSGGATVHNLTENTESKTPSAILGNLSQESKTSKKSTKVETAQDLVDIVEPSQILPRSRPEDEESLSNKLSQSTIADFFAATSEDAVVPEANLSQQSEPFEE